MSKNAIQVESVHFDLQKSSLVGDSVEEYMYNQSGTDEASTVR